MSLRQLFSASRGACSHSNPSPGRLLPILRTTSQFLCQNLAHAKWQSRPLRYGTAIKIRFPWVNNSPPFSTSGQQWFFLLLVNCLSVKLQDLQACTILRKNHQRLLKILLWRWNSADIHYHVLFFAKQLERERFYRKMLDDKKNWPYYSAALVLVQKDFVRKRPALVKDLIRLVKYWRKTYIPQIGHERLPPSYLLELLTIHAWENANCPTSFDMKIGFKAVMEVLKNHRSLRVSWGHYYRRDLIPNRYHSWRV